MRGRARQVAGGERRFDGAFKLARVDGGRPRVGRHDPCVLRAHGLLPMLMRELTVPTPYGADGDEG